MLKESVSILNEGDKITGSLTIPKNPIGSVVFAHIPSGDLDEAGCDEIIQKLFEDGVASLRLDLLTDSEARKKGMGFNVKLLRLRLESALDWISRHKNLTGLPLGLIGLETGAAAAIEAAAVSKHEITAVVCADGRIDMAQKYLPYVEAPCLLIVGQKDELALQANKSLIEHLNYGRFHALENPSWLWETSAISETAGLAARWFRRYFNKRSYQEHNDEYTPDKLKVPFYDRFEASHFLARALEKYKKDNPLVLAIPRGAVAMADIIATELDCDMDVILVKKIGIPNNPDLAIGSVNEFGDVYLSSGAKAYANEDEISNLAALAQKKLKHYRDKLGSHHNPISYQGRTVIIIDDGIATGSTMLSAVITATENGAKNVVVAAPVASKSAEKMLKLAADDTVFLDVPENFYAVSQFYENFPQIGDGEVEQILR